MRRVKNTTSLKNIHAAAGWSGNAEELAEQASTLLREGPRGEITERLVRDYVSRRILRRPHRQGRGAMFGYHQLLQILAARILLKEEGWPLQKIAEFVGLAPEEGLIGIISQHSEPNPAIAVARSLASESLLTPSASMAARPAIAPHATGPVPNRSHAATAAEKLGWREEFRRVRRSLGARDEELRIANVIRIAIAPGFCVEIESERLRSITEEDATFIGRAVSLALMEAAIPKGGKK